MNKIIVSPEEIGRLTKQWVDERWAMCWGVFAEAERVFASRNRRVAGDILGKVALQAIEKVVGQDERPRVTAKYLAQQMDWMLGTYFKTALRVTQFTKEQRKLYFDESYIE